MKKNTLSYILALIVAAGIVVVDQYTKGLAVEKLMNENGEAPRPFIKGLLEFNLVENTGGAWGILSDYTWILVSITVVVTVIVIALLLKHGPDNKLVFWAATFVLGGGIGNMIDRVFNHGKVIDFLHFAFWQKFPTFNIADCAVVIGACLLVLYFVLDTIGDYKRRRTVKTDSDEENNADI